jgi:hypothetical protein
MIGPESRCLPCSYRIIYSHTRYTLRLNAKLHSVDIEVSVRFTCVAVRRVGDDKQQDGPLARTLKRQVSSEITPESMNESVGRPREFGTSAAEVVNRNICTSVIAYQERDDKRVAFRHRQIVEVGFGGER